MIHCELTDCRHNDPQAQTCGKTDIIIAKEGCKCYTPRPPERDETEGGGNDS